jgi:hypothetical protein
MPSQFPLQDYYHHYFHLQKKKRSTPCILRGSTQYILHMGATAQALLPAKASMRTHIDRVIFQLTIDPPEKLDAERGVLKVLCRQ